MDRLKLFPTQVQAYEIKLSAKLNKNNNNNNNNNKNNKILIKKKKQ